MHIEHKSSAFNKKQWGTRISLLIVRLSQRQAIFLCRAGLDRTGEEKNND